MSQFFTPAERAMLDNLPESELVELAAELGVTVPAVIRRHQLMDQVLHELACHVRIHGLPLSHYDEDDLRALAPAELAALAGLVGVTPRVNDLLKAGKKAYKTYTRRKATSPIPLMVPTLLAPLARYAQQQSQS